MDSKLDRQGAVSPGKVFCFFMLTKSQNSTLFSEERKVFILRENATDFGGIALSTSSNQLSNSVFFYTT